MKTINIFIILAIAYLHPYAQEINYYEGSDKILSKIYYNSDSTIISIENFYKNGNLWTTAKYDTLGSRIQKEYSRRGKLKRVSCFDSTNHIVSSVHFFNNGDTSHVNEKNFKLSTSYYKNGNKKYIVEPFYDQEDEYRYTEFYRNGKIKYSWDRKKREAIHYNRNGDIKK